MIRDAKFAVGNPSPMRISERDRLKIRRARDSDSVPWELLLDADGPRAIVEK
jgi:hypothetical protein